MPYLVDTDILIDLFRRNEGATKYLDSLNNWSVAFNLMKSYSKSHSLETSDALIAATAIHAGLKLSTLNRKHFGAIGGLEIEVPDYK